MWIIEYYAPWCGHCVKLKPEYKKAAEGMHGIVKFGAINCDLNENKSLCAAENIPGYPTIKIHAIDATGSRQSSKVYEGARTAKSITDEAASQVPKSALKVLNAKNYSAFLDRQQQPKLILFSERTIPTLFSYLLSAQFNSKVEVAFAPKTVEELVEKFSITQFPTVVTISTDGTVEKVEEKEKINVHHLRKMLTALSKVRRPIVELSTQASLESECLSTRNQICAIAFLTKEEEFPESLQEFEQNHSILSNVNNDFEDIRFFWVNPLKHKGLLETLKVPDIFPGLVIVKPSRNIYRALNTPYDSQSIAKFLRSVLDGKIKMNEYKGNLLLDAKHKSSDEL